MESVEVDLEQENAALVSNTMVCEVARLLEYDAETINCEWSDRIRRSVSLADFLSLAEAVVLHQTLYTLPGRMADDAEALTLRSELIRQGVLRELDTQHQHESIARSLLNAIFAFGEVPSLELGKRGGPIPPWKVANVRARVARFLGVSEDDELLWPGSDCLLGDTVDCFGWEGDPSRRVFLASLNDCASHLIQVIDNGGTGAYEVSVSWVRDMYYIVVAEQFGLPYWPQSTRRAFAERFPNYLTSSEKLKLYRRLAEAFECTVTEIYDDQKQESAFIPPFAALVLDRARNSRDLVRSLLEVRQEFSELRCQLAEIDQSWREAVSIGERIKLRRKLRCYLNEVGMAFEKPQSIHLERIIRYVPKMAGPIAEPGNLASYSESLLLLPAKALARWWRRRPISRLFDLAGAVEQIDAYGDLLRRVFGRDFQEGLVVDFDKRQGWSYRNL